MITRFDFSMANVRLVLTFDLLEDQEVILDGIAMILFLKKVLPAPISCLLLICDLRKFINFMR
ncbi:hypothetical protein EAG18_04955 [Pseudoalteromonas sp. J010]|nr:hypothetical protein EAG18_04955 [Pseudoalteromonas sp. J010]